jgi:4'-phosphopantetheinyl transferase
MSTIFSNGVFDVIVERISIDTRTVEKAEALLSEDEVARAGRFVFDRDRKHYIVARANLRKELSERLGLRPESVKFDYGKYGKPVLAKNVSSRSLYFNASRSNDVAAYAFAEDREIGVDVEAVRDLPDINDVAEHCFSDRENADFRSLEEMDRLKGFFNCWTRKEAFVKAIGEGLSHPLHDFDVSLVPGKAAQMLRVGDVAGKDCGWEVHRFSPFPGYVGAVVVKSPARKK